MRLLHRFISFVSFQGDQPGPPTPEKGGHVQVPKASASYWAKDGNDTFVGDVSKMNSGGVNPFGGDEQDGVITSSGEHHPQAVCH